VSTYGTAGAGVALHLPSLSQLAWLVPARTGERTETVQSPATNVSPIVPDSSGAPGLAQTLRGALSVDNTVVYEGEDTGRARRGSPHCHTPGHGLGLPALHLTGTLSVEVAVSPPVCHHHAFPVHLSGAPGGLGPSEAAALVSDSLEDEGEDTGLARDGGAQLWTSVHDLQPHVLAGDKDKS